MNNILYKKLFTYLTIIIIFSYHNSFANSFDCFPYFDNGYIIAMPALTLKQITLYVLSSSLKSIFQPKTLIYTLGLVGCLTGGKLLYYSQIASKVKKLSIDKEKKDIDNANNQKFTETKTPLDKRFQTDPAKKFPDYSYTQCP